MPKEKMKIDDSLFELIETLKLAIEKYGKMEVRVLVRNVCYNQSAVPKRRTRIKRCTSLEHLRGDSQ